MFSQKDYAEEIADLWRAYAKCESLQAKKCNQKNPNSCLQPEIETSSVSTGEMIAGAVLVTAGVVAHLFLVGKLSPLLQQLLY